MPLEIILNYIFGSTTLVSIYIAWRSRNSELKKSEASALEGIDSAYDKMVTQVNKQFDKMQKRIEELENKLDQYVKQCSECSNNKIGIK